MKRLLTEYDIRKIARNVIRRINESKKVNHGKVKNNLSDFDFFYDYDEKILFFKDSWGYNDYYVPNFDLSRCWVITDATFIVRDKERGYTLSHAGERGMRSTDLDDKLITYLEYKRIRNRIEGNVNSQYFIQEMRETSLGVFLVTYYDYKYKTSYSVEVNVQEIKKIYNYRTSNISYSLV